MYGRRNATDFGHYRTTTSSSSSVVADFEIYNEQSLSHYCNDDDGNDDDDDHLIFPLDALDSIFDFEAKLANKIFMNRMVRCHFIIIMFTIFVLASEN